MASNPAVANICKPAAPLDASRVTVTLTETPKPIPAPEDLVFGLNTTDHMLIMEHDPVTGWSAPEIKPYAKLELDPASSCFHYCPNVFEGMKAYLGPDGKPRLFRPNMNMARLERSADRVALPMFDSDAVLTLIKQLVLIDKRWIPQIPGYSLYIRPTIIGTRPALGVSASDHALLYVIMSPMGPYFRTGPTPVSLLAIGETVRAWPGGTGAHKMGSNYCSTFKPQREAAKLGYDQVLWLLGPERKITEAGSMNFFVVVKRDNGDLDIYTPPLDGTILPGLTRASCLALAGSHSEETPLPYLPGTQRIYASERILTIGDLVEWSSQERLMEAFGVGTAVIIAPVGRIGYTGEKDIHIPTYPGGYGPIGKALWDRVVAIQEGRFEWDGWSVVC